MTHNKDRLAINLKRVTKIRVLKKTNSKEILPLKEIDQDFKWSDITHNSLLVVSISRVNGMAE